MYTEIECPSCHKIVRSGNVKPKEIKVTCSSCGQLFSFKKDIDIRLRQKYKIHQPDLVTMLKTEQLLELNFSMGIIPKGCSFWPVFGVIAGLLMFLLFVGSFTQMSFFLSLFMDEDSRIMYLVFIGIILIFSYAIAAQFSRIQNVSKIDIKAEKEKLTVTHINKNKTKDKNTKPQRLNKVFKANDIVQFYVIEQTITGHFFYTLSAINKSNEVLEIVPISKDLQILLFAEQELELFYNIQDRKIEEEVTI